MHAKRGKISFFFIPVFFETICPSSFRSELTADGEKTFLSSEICVLLEIGSPHFLHTYPEPTSSRRRNGKRFSSCSSEQFWWRREKLWSRILQRSKSFVGTFSCGLRTLSRSRSHSTNFWNEPYVARVRIQVQTKDFPPMAGVLAVSILFSVTTFWVIIDFITPVRTDRGSHVYCDVMSIKIMEVHGSKLNLKWVGRVNLFFKYFWSLHTE